MKNIRENITVIVLIQKTFLKPFEYNGPGTQIKLREQLGDTQVVGDLDQYAKNHDYTYLHEKKEYNKYHDKSKHIKNIWNADDIFIEKAKHSKDEPIMGPISSNLISMKKNLEQKGMDTNRFSGFGTDNESENNDPVSRLRSLVQEKHAIKAKQEKKHKNQKGGFAPLIAVGLPILGALAGEFVKDLYSVIKRKLTGSGVKMNHSSLNNKNFFYKIL